MNTFAFLSSTGDLEEDIRHLTIRVVLVSAISLTILVLAAAITKNKFDHLRLPLFSLIAFVVIVATSVMFGSTVYLNMKSDSGGPVHWHADFEIWACGVQLELRNPSGFLSNKIGTPTLHEHDDQRIHLEGVVVDEKVDASLGKFMRVIGGSLSNSNVIVPLADEILEDEVDGDKVDPRGQELINQYIRSDSFGKKIFIAEKGNTCDGEYSEPQTYVYRYNGDNKTYSQTKLSDHAAYVIRDESVVPPGDCIIIEFGPVRDTTDKLCRQYGVRDIDRCVEFGVEEFTPKLCELRQVSAGGSQ